MTDENTIQTDKHFLSTQIDPARRQQLRNTDKHNQLDVPQLNLDWRRRSILKTTERRTSWFIAEQYQQT